MKTAAVVTVTNGKRLSQLEECVASIRLQTYPVTHYILCDQNYEKFTEIRSRFPDCQVSFWPKRIGGEGWLGQRWLAAASHLITEEVTFFCNDDDWYKHNHVQTIMNKIEDGNDWAYALRSIYDENGKFLFDDNCEALGELHHAWNQEGHHFVDWCMWGMKTDCLKQIAVVLNRPSLLVDREFYAAARQIFPKFASTQLHTFCFRLGGGCGVQKEFFEIGNLRLREKFNNKLPWIIT